jgi:hypothetical protein
MQADATTILTCIHDHRMDIRRIACALRTDANIALHNGRPELAEKVDALADAITDVVNAHLCID